MAIGKTLVLDFLRKGKGIREDFAACRKSRYRLSYIKLNLSSSDKRYQTQ